MELFKGGSLTDRLRSRGCLTDGESRAVAHSVLSALDFMHRRGFVHRDIKPDNCMYTQNPDASITQSPEPIPADEPVLKLIDLGLGGKFQVVPTKGTPGNPTPHQLRAQTKGTPGKRFSASDSAAAKGTPANPPGVVATPQQLRALVVRPQLRALVGTPKYVAPEVLTSRARGPHARYSHLCDLWSLGAMLCQALTGFGLFHGAGGPQVQVDVQKFAKDNFPLRRTMENSPEKAQTARWEHVSGLAKEFLKRVLVGENERATADESLRDAWIQQNENKNLRTRVSTGPCTATSEDERQRR